MLVYNFHVPFSYESLASTASLRKVFHLLKDSYISRNWATIRNLLTGDARTAHVASLEERVWRCDSAAVRRVDEWIMSKRTIGAAAADKAFLQLTDELKSAQYDKSVLHAWLYWKYSSDVLGSGKGISRTLITKAFHLGVTQALWLEVPVSCPHCAGTATLRSTSVMPRVEYTLDASLSCSICRHTEVVHHFQTKDTAVLNCDCAHCVGVRTEAAQLARKCAASSMNATANELRKMVADVVASLSAGRRQKELSNGGRRFMAMADANPSASLLELIKYMMPWEAKRMVHPYHFWVEAWKVLPDLVSDGILNAYFDIEELSKDNQELLEKTIRGRNAMFMDERYSDSMVHDLTTFLLGPKSDAKEHIKQWITSVDEIGFDQSWSVLPLTFQFAVNRDRLQTLTNGASAPFKPEAVYVYSSCDRSWSVNGSSEISQIYRDMRAPKGLVAKRNELLAAVRELAAPAMARKFEAEYLLNQDDMPSLEDAKAQVRSQLAQCSVSLHTPAGKVLAKHLYWSMCRDVVGVENGVTLKSIMDYFGCQKAQFSKLIDETSAPLSCPCCSATGEVARIRLGGSSRLESAVFKCHACEHTESLGFDGLNTISCSCQSCKNELTAGLSKVRELAAGIADRLVSGALSLPDMTESHQWIGGMRNDSAMSYAQLRMVGKTAAQSAHILFHGSIYDSTIAFDKWPVWVMHAVESKILIADGREALQGVDAMSFVRDSLNLFLSESGRHALASNLSELEECLVSGSGELFGKGVMTLECLLRGGFLLPRRLRCVENELQITNLAHYANKAGMEPSHVLSDVRWFTKSDKEFTARRIPVWPR